MKRHILAVAALMMGCLGVAHAQAYPNKVIKMVVPFAAGGNADITARLLARRMSESMGVPVIIDNKPGANGSIGVEAVVRALPDGYTLLLSASSPLVVNPVLYAKVPYDPIRDLQPISQILNYQYALVVPAKSSITSLSDLAAQAKAQPGVLTYGSSGIGGGSHLAGELLALMMGAKLNHIPYKGTAPALADLLGGHLSFTFDTILTTVPQVEGKHLRALAVSGSKRASSLPQVPTLQELGYKGFDISQFVGLLAPAKTDPAIVARLHQEVVKAMKAPEIIQALKTEGGNDLVANTPVEFRAQIVRDLALNRKLIKDANIKEE
jgi:tripartite-type tricarboxylate transporter receptor subunit TctC